MTGSNRSEGPAFFDDATVDPVQSAIGRQRSKPIKRKAGFYLSESLLQRFDRKYHELKLAGAPIENKSALLERALAFALDDMDRGEKSKVLASVQTSFENRQP